MKYIYNNPSTIDLPYRHATFSLTTLLNAHVELNNIPSMFIEGFIINKCENPQTPLYTYFDQETYNLCLKNLVNNKTPRPNKIPNSILKNMPSSFHHILFLFFIHCYKLKQIPTSWKISLIILLYKKGNPSLLTNHRPIALANYIYKFFTSMFTSILSAYVEKHQILHNSQEGFRVERCTSRQLQLLITVLKDAQFTNQDIYLIYIDFKNAFGSIDHTRLLSVMKDLGYSEDAVKLVGNIYSKSNTIFIGEHFGQTQKYQYKGEQSKETLLAHTYSLYF